MARRSTELRICERAEPRQVAAPRRAASDRSRRRHEAPQLPMDYFFRSLAEDQGERAICIILSGTAARWDARPEGDQGRVGHGDGAGGGIGEVRRDAAECDRRGLGGLRGAGGRAAEAAGGVSAVAPRGARRRWRRAARSRIAKVVILLRSRTGHDFSSTSGARSAGGSSGG